jgi:hypothetical protein
VIENCYPEGTSFIFELSQKKSHFLFDHWQASAMDRDIELTGAGRNSIVLIDCVGQWIWHRNGSVAGNTRYVFSVCVFRYGVQSVSVCK